MGWTKSSFTCVAYEKLGLPAITPITGVGVVPVACLPVYLAPLNGLSWLDSVGEDVSTPIVTQCAEWEVSGRSSERDGEGRRGEAFMLEAGKMSLQSA